MSSLTATEKASLDKVLEIAKAVLELKTDTSMHIQVFQEAVQSSRAKENVVRFTRQKVFDQIRELFPDTLPNDVEQLAQTITAKITGHPA